MFIVHRRVLSAALLCGAAMVASAGFAGAESPQGTDRTAGQSMSAAQSLGVAETATGGEVELSSVATSKAQSPAVQKLAQAIINDHSEAGKRARALAEKLRVRVTPSATSNALQKEADDATARVDKVAGPTFDRVYVEGTIRFHQKVLNAIDEALPGVGSKEVKDLFNEVRVRVERELDVAKTMLASLAK
jgi:putative membrane protein